MDNSVIQFTHVSKSYGMSAIRVLQDVSFSVRAEEFFCIVGPSGCGKSTILKIIAGLENQSSGTVEKPREVAMVFQNGSLFPWLTVFDNIAFGLRAKNTDDRHIRTETEKFVELTGLKEFAQKFPRDLSGGQRQRVGIARALAVNPKVLLLDEPFSALDTLTTEELHKDLLSIWHHLKQTIVMVSHSIEEAVTLADRIMLLKQGKIEKTFEVNLVRPRREQETVFAHHVAEIRNEFFRH